LGTPVGKEPRLYPIQSISRIRLAVTATDPDTKGLVEFCFDEKYYQFNENYSESYTNGSAFQAFRAGFREGVKMSLDQGAKVKDLKSVWWQNYHRLLIWCNVGADVTNGLWSIYGAREGAYLTNCTDWDYTNVRDFDYLTQQWETEYSKITEEMLPYEIMGLGETLKHECGLETADVTPSASKFFKTVFNNTPRTLRKKS
jgi:hypothetical protein